MLIERSKGGRTHYATAVAPAGNVTGWTEDRSKGADVDASLRDAIKGHYEGRPNGGSIVADGRILAVGAESAEAPAEAPTEVKLSKAGLLAAMLPDPSKVTVDRVEFEELEADNKHLDKEVTRLRAEVERLKSESDLGWAKAKQYEAENATLRADLKAAEDLKQEAETPAD